MNIGSCIASVFGRQLPFDKPVQHVTGAGLTHVIAPKSGQNATQRDAINPCKNEQLWRAKGHGDGCSIADRQRAGMVQTKVYPRRASVADGGRYRDSRLQTGKQRGIWRELPAGPVIGGRMPP